MAALPRPILKHSNSSHRNNAVHFPPPPSLTRTFIAYSSATYDRSPIIVAPNSCAIPPRGCPGRTYAVDEPRTQIPTGRALHPRALPPLDPPPLIPDLSSESDESDAFLASPFDPLQPPPPTTTPTKSIPPQYPIYPHFNCPPDPTTALSFLPHPPSPAQAPFPPYYDDECPQPPAAARKRPLQRRRERSRDRDRIRTTDGGERDDEAEGPVRARGGRVRVVGFGFADPDVGCLGGF